MRLRATLLTRGGSIHGTGRLGHRPLCRGAPEVRSLRQGSPGDSTGYRRDGFGPTTFKRYGMMWYGVVWCGMRTTSLRRRRLGSDIQDFSETHKTSLRHTRLGSDYKYVAQNTRQGVVWSGVWFGVVWLGLVWFGMVWFGVAWCGVV